MLDRRNLGRAEIAVAILLLLLCATLVRTAWVSDDAYITFRTADNIVHGYGPVWNTGERVQAYTHPLWLAVFTGVYAVSREAYLTSIALTIALTFVTVGFVGRRVALSTLTFSVFLAALVSSKAFIDFSTSGLENALSHLLLAAFLWVWCTHPDGPRRLQHLTSIAGLCLLNRLDLGVLVAPALAAETLRLGLRRAVRPALTGMIPFLAWEAFSLFYYGSLVPNTAYAKLNVSFSRADLIAPGLAYFHRTIVSDPVTLPVALLAPIAAAWQRRREWPLVAGVAVHLLYVVWIGGDFMMGRFFTAPFVVGAVLLSRLDWVATGRRAAIAAGVIVATGLAAPWEPALLSGYGYTRLDNVIHGYGGAGARDQERFIYLDDVMDERRYYYESTGLLKRRLGAMTPDHPMAVDGQQLRESGTRVAVRDGIGFTGYFAGPGVHIVDEMALADPLLSRLPATGGRIGHFRREVPGGYVASIESGENRIEDPGLAALYDRVRLVVSGPLWSWARLRAIAGLGRYDRAP